MNDKNKKKQHDCEWRKWIEEVYAPWYNNRSGGTSEGDEGGNPGGPPPPPPPVFEDDNG